MSTLSGFNTWDDVAIYIEETMGITYTDDPTSWVEAMKELTKGYKYVRVVNEITGETTTQLMKEDLVVGVGEYHIGENTSGSSVITGGGGVKTAPTAKSVITNNSGGGTAVITEEATGVKDTGIVNGVTGMGIISGLLQIYGLIHTGIQIANAQVWKDMSNYVYATDFDEDTPLERVIEFLGKKIINTVTDITSDGDLVVNIPDSIAQRMYDFLSNHMIQGQTPGIYPSMEGIELVYNFITRTLELSNPEFFTLERYRSATNPTTATPIRIIDISDDLFKVFCLDFGEQAIGRGFNISNSVLTALASSMEGMWQYLKTASVDAVENANVCDAVVIIRRGSGTPISQPISLAELSVGITCSRDTTLNIITEGGDKFLSCTENFTPDYAYPGLARGYSYQAGDCVKYLKRGRTGSSDNDYAFVVCADRDAYTPGTSIRERWEISIDYPSNERRVTYNHVSNSETGALGPYRSVNGYAPPSYGAHALDFADALLEPADTLFARGYSNIGYRGSGDSYEPDDYLITAGFKSRKDSSGIPDVTPSPDKTKEQRYPSMRNKKQQANPQTVMISDVPVVQNSITDYVPTTVPFGSENTNRLIKHGMNNPDDPESYQDNRPQTDKLTGKINTADPVSGFNEATETVIKEYNESKNDPTHYPDPIPANEPNPQYPTNPPSETEGDTGDTPDPSVLPGVTASGMVSVYNPTKQEVKNFSAWLWTDNVIENLKKILANPVDAIIGLHIMYATPITGSPENIICGYLDSGVQAKVVTQQYIDVDCGHVTIPEYYGNVFDYEPYTTVHVYLPFVGIQALKANDVIGKDLYISYGVDVLTGTCLARLTTKKGSSEICCYQFAGNCAVQIPLTGGNYAEIIKSIASMAVGVAGSVITANPLPAIGGIIGGAMGASFDVSKSGSLGANAGVMGIRNPYVIITRRIGYEASNYNQFYGYPANKTVVLGTCAGYTRVKSVHIDSIPIATDSEKTEIETLLRQGVIIK